MRGRNKVLVKSHNVCNEACTFLNSFAMFWRSKQNYPKSKTPKLNLLNGEQNPHQGKSLSSRVSIRLPLIWKDVTILWALGNFGKTMLLHWLIGRQLTPLWGELSCFSIYLKSGQNIELLIPNKLQLLFKWFCYSNYCLISAFFL